MAISDHLIVSEEKSNIFLNIKLSGRHITEIWLPEQPLKSPGRAAPGSSELAALKLALTLHLHGRSEAPCSATTSEAGPPLRVERTACFASRINTCVCCCCFLFDWCFFCARSSVFLHQRSTSSSLSLPVTLTFQLGLPSAFFVHLIASSVSWQHCVCSPASLPS